MPQESGVLGIYGGTFDPVHFGHLRLAEEARQNLELCEVRWIPTGDPRHRPPPEVGAQQRLDMVRLALASNPAFTLDSSEVEQQSPSYTVPTLERLRTELGGHRPLVLLLGADAFAGLVSWHRWRDLFTLAHIGLSHRPGVFLDSSSLPSGLAQEYCQRQQDNADCLRESPAGCIVPFAMTQLAISATAIRTCLQQGESPRYLLPDTVIDYIRRHKLYRKL